MSPVDPLGVGGDEPHVRAVGQGDRRTTLPGLGRIEPKKTHRRRRAFFGHGEVRAIAGHLQIIQELRRIVSGRRRLIVGGIADDAIPGVDDVVSEHANLVLLIRRREMSVIIAAIPRLFRRTRSIAPIAP